MQKRFLPNVLVVLPLSLHAGQKKLAGIFSSRKTSAWNLALLRGEDEFTPEIHDRVRAGSFNGVIATVRTGPAIFRTLAAAPCPVVMMDAEPTEFATRRNNLVFIHNDPTLITRRAIETFDRVGRFADYAYVPDAINSHWSRARESNYRKLLALRGTKLRVANSDLQRFLTSLIRPAAVLAANDVTAMNILTAAAAQGLEIPDELSILGVDDEGLLCENARITLSSIEPDFEEEGRTAALLLDRMMRSRRTMGRQDITVGVRRVVLRESTHSLPPAQKLIERAERYIAEHATDGISPPDVVRHLGVSHALINMRLRQFKRPTLHAQLSKTRLAAVKKALLESDHSIARIAADCGFKNPKSLGNLFHSQMGVSMADYRRQS